LSGLSTGYISYILRQYEVERGQIVPTWGAGHDIGPSVTDKAEVIRRWLCHELPAQIARAINHFQKAVDRYIADYQKIRLLAQKFPVTELPTLSGLTAQQAQLDPDRLSFISAVRVLQQAIPEFQMTTPE